jgi:anti-sigma28 factor (negative regulator of flagellin synthesis)
MTTPPGRKTSATVRTVTLPFSAPRARLRRLRALIEAGRYRVDARRVADCVLTRCPRPLGLRPVADA